MATRLSELGVERLKPGDKRIEIPDGGCPGLFLQLQPSGAKSWALRCRIGGKPAKLTIGKYPVLTVRDAREKARETVALVDRGIDPRAEAARLKEEKAAAAANTLRAIAERFRDQVMVKSAPRSWRDRWAALDHHVLASLGDKPIDSIRRRDLHACLDGLADKPGARHHTLSAVSALFTWASDREIIENNPAVRLPRPKAGVRQRVLSDAEIPTVWRVADGAGFPYGPYIKLLLLTGCRRNELAGLQWPEIDQAVSVITIPPDRFKGARTHALPLSDMARRLIEDLPRFDGPFVFSTMGGRVPISGFSKLHARFEAALARQCEKVGAEPIVFGLHDLRRTVRTGLSALRVPPHVAEAVLGHVVGGVEKHYNFYDFLDEKRAALEAWGGYVTRLLNPATNVIDIRMAK